MASLSFNRVTLIVYAFLWLRQ